MKKASKYIITFLIAFTLVLSSGSFSSRASSLEGYYVILPSTSDLYEGIYKTASQYCYFSEVTFDDSMKLNLDTLGSNLFTRFGNNFVVLGYGYCGTSNYVISFSAPVNIITCNYITMYGEATCNSFYAISDSPFTFDYGTFSFLNDGSIGSGSSTSGSAALGSWNGTEKYIFAFGASSSVLYSDPYNLDFTLSGGSNYIGNFDSGRAKFRFSSCPIYTVYEDSSISVTPNLRYWDYFYQSVLGYTFSTPINSRLNILSSDGVHNDVDTGIGEPEVEVESNSNHMYFKDCEIGFCYPKSSPAPVSFGGAYFYIKYQVDDWIVNHISDYNLVFYADAEVGNEVTNTVRYEVALDPDGCITIPFSRVWIDSLTSKGFSVLVTDREIEDNFYKAYLYSLSPAGFIDFGNKAAASNQSSISGALNALVSGGIDSFLYYINGDSIDLYSALSEVATSISVKYNPYIITAFTLLTDGTDNSGLFEMEFDLVAGTEDVTDTGGLVNPDPFVPEDNPDYTPPAPTPGNSTTPGYNIVPSGFWQGTMNAVIGYDPGYRDLKSDIDRDPDGNFSQYLDPMHNDDVGSWFMSFVNEMPTEMKSILIAGVGVGVLFGLYRFIRRG